MRPRRLERARAALVCALLSGGCESEGERLRVFAASSFSDAASALETGFEAAHPDVDVVNAHAGSQVLRLQIEQGAPAGVFVSADRAHVDALVDAGRAVDPRAVARSELVLIVPRDNPADIRGFEDLARAPRLVVGHPGSPVGRYTASLLERAEGIWGPALVEAVRARVVSEERNVRRVRAKVELGEADAAFVYRADLSPGVRAIALPPELAVSATYHAARIVDAPPSARSWLDHLEGPEGRAALAAAGFEAP